MDLITTSTRHPRKQTDASQRPMDMTPPPPTRYITTCPVGCAPPLQSTPIVLPEGPLLRCPHCGQLVSQCSEALYWQSMQEFNDPRGTMPDARSAARGFRRGKKYLDHISALLGKAPAATRLLDVGCSSGAFLTTAVKLGYAAEGVEPAERAAATAQASGLKVHQGLLHEAAYADASFDAISLLEVIEHLKEPLPLLREVQRILKPGGIFLIGTGNAASWSAQSFGAHWDYFSIAKHGGHISFFNPKSIEKLAAQADFSVAQLKTRSVRFGDRGNTAEPAYTLFKIAAELVNPLAAWWDQGEDMAVYFRKN